VIRCGKHNTPLEKGLRGHLFCPTCVEVSRESHEYGSPPLVCDLLDCHTPGFADDVTFVFFSSPLEGLADRPKEAL